MNPWGSEKLVFCGVPSSNFHSMERRAFIKNTALFGGGMLATFSCTERETSSYYFFTVTEASCVIAICEQIIPADKEPGATDAEVINYIDRELRHIYKQHQKLYRNGIAALQASCKQLKGELFEDLPFDEQTALLIDMEKSKLPKTNWRDAKQGAFFQTIRKHTIEGFYSNPQHGGNKDHVSFEMMRIEPPYLF